MKKKTLGLAVLTAIMMMNLGACAGCNRNDTPVITTPTAGVTATVAPTVEPTVKPAFTPTAVPTPTEIPATPTPIPTPEPTATPMPTMKLEYRFQMGDDVWYEYYEDSTVLVVSGTGSTWDFDDYVVRYLEVALGKQTRSRQKIMATNPNALGTMFASADAPKSPEKIIVQEGITRLGREALATLGDAVYIELPLTLTEVGEYAFMNTGEEGAEWVGLDFDRIDVASNAFLYSYGLDYDSTVQYREQPSPTPLPTATPLPNPDKPRLVESKKMGDNITYEFWDNGYLYVKGTGATWDQSFYFTDFEGDFYQTIKNVIIEEGVTAFGDRSLAWISSVSYWKVPKTLVAAGLNNGGGDMVTFDCYIDGKPATVKTHHAEHTRAGLGVLVNEIFPDIDAAIAKGYEIIYH